MSFKFICIAIEHDLGITQVVVVHLSIKLVVICLNDPDVYIKISGKSTII